MRVPTTLRRLASMVSVTVALGALAAACGSSGSSSASLVASASSHLESAKTYDVDVSLETSGAFSPTHEIHAEVDAPLHLTLVTFQLGSLTLRELVAPPHLYLQVPNITTSASPSATWYALPTKSLTPPVGTAESSKIGQLLASVFHPKLDGHVVVSGQTCTLVTASTSLASLEKSLGTTSLTPGVHPAGNVTVEVAISPAGYPLRVVEHVNAGQLHEVVTEDFSDFGAPLHITAPSPSHIKKISLAQLGGLLGGLGQ
jgi:hypothetical protein